MLVWMIMAGCPKETPSAGPPLTRSGPVPCNHELTCEDISLVFTDLSANLGHVEIKNIHDSSHGSFTNSSPNGDYDAFLTFKHQGSATQPTGTVQSNTYNYQDTKFKVRIRTDDKVFNIWQDQPNGLTSPICQEGQP
jgi:hypothetical protein